MNIEVMTRSDMQHFKDELLSEIKKLVGVKIEEKQWLKSSEVMKMLACSPGTLQNLRVNGALPFTKMGGTIYYDSSDVHTVMEKNKQNAA